jgi:hypothetical protein
MRPRVIEISIKYLRANSELNTVIAKIEQSYKYIAAKLVIGIKKDVMEGII